MKTKQNLELKHFCNDFGKIRETLKKIGAKKDSVKKQKDFFFNLPKKDNGSKARLKLRIENKKMTLVYYEREDFVAGKDTSSDILLLEVNKETFNFLEKSLGISAIVEKQREVWRKENTVFHLDTVKDVGMIFEVELQKIGKVTEKDRKIFLDYQRNLIPFLGKVIKGSNIDLILMKK